MVVDRRSFLKTAVTVPFLAPVTVAVAQGRVSPIGLQLYTVRSELQKDFERTLAAVAAIGYTEVELAFVEDLARSPQQIRTALRSSGLAGVSAHVRFDALGDRWRDTVDVARTIGQTYVVINSIDPGSSAQPGIWQRASEQFNRAGEVCKAAGIRLAYHNHMFEFANTTGAPKRPYEILAESTDPALVSFQMDLCWITAAGQTPLTYFRRYPGRFVSAHVKDLKRMPLPPPRRAAVLPDLTDVGQGILDWRELLSQCWSAGIRHYFVEHDEPAQPLASAERSYRYIEALRFDAAR